MPTQAARSASTRQSLIDAAVTLLAGTSRGSLRHHFPDWRYDLLPAMLGWLLEREAARLDALGPLSPSLRLHLMLHILASRPQRHTSRVRAAMQG